jgi:hypothetical protein
LRYARAVNPLQSNPHIALSVAAGLAHRQLAVQPREFYDVEHYSEVLNLVAQALTRVAQIYVAEQAGAAREGLSGLDLEGASVRRGATVLVLADGRTFRHIWVRRDDLRNAITILASTGIRGFTSQRAPK